MGQLMELDLKKISLREINNTLQSLDMSQEDQNFTITNPEAVSYTHLTLPTNREV